jgi:axial budding pattern protein 2
MRYSNEALLLLTLASFANANAYVGFPFDEQLPDIARVGENYQFGINPQTFKSDDNSPVKYKAYGLPQWLNFDANSLELSGSPTTSDTAGKFDFTLEGTDSQSSLNQTCSIYLSDQPAPEINPNNTVITQLEDIGYTNGYAGIVLDPQESFKITFNEDSFLVPSSSNNKIVAYYGKSANRTSLPSWCFFDSDTLTFSGTAPPVNAMDAPSLQFDLTLIATDYQGYSAAYSDFRIVVGGHNLYMKNATGFNNSIMVNPGDSFSIPLPLDQIYLDDNVITAEQIASVNNYNGPSWVTITDKSKVEGTVPLDETANTVVNITLFDVYGDSVFMNFDINVMHDVFSVNSLKNVTVKDGEFFQYTLPSSMFQNETATDLVATFSDTWLTFYHSNNTFVGQVPKNFQSSQITLDGSINSLKQTLTFFLVGNPITSSSSRYSSATRSSSIRPTSSHHSRTGTSSAGVSATSTYGDASATSTSTPTSTLLPVVSDKKSSNSKKNLAIGLGVAIPVAAIIAGSVIVFFCCCGKRRKNNNDDNGNGGDDNEKGVPPYGAIGAAAITKNSSNSTLNHDTTAARILAEKNLNNLEKNNDDVSSYYSATQSTLKSGSDHKLYQAANEQFSTDQLIGSNARKSSGGIFNSWRKSSNVDLNARDSLGSLATVATSDLLTVNVVNDGKVRKSQMILPQLSRLRNMNNSSDSTFDGSSNNVTTIGGSNTNSKEFNGKLETLREDDNGAISRDRSYESMISNAHLVGFDNNASYSTQHVKRAEKSYHAELYNADDHSSNFSNDSN